MGSYYLNDITREVVSEDITDVDRHFIVRATIDHFDTDIEKVAYQACPLDSCKKKVLPVQRFVPGISLVTELYYCSKCRLFYSIFKYRYMLKAYLVDVSETEGIRVTLFDEAAEPLLGIPASELLRIYENDRSEYYSRLSQPLQKTFTIMLRAKMIIWEENGQRYFNGIIDELRDLEEVRRPLAQLNL